MKRFHYAIKAIDNEMLRIIGKVATQAVEKGHDPTYSLKMLRVKNLKEAIKILEEHERNTHV